MRASNFSSKVMLELMITRVVARPKNGFFVARIVFGLRGWAELLGQGETLALIPNMMDNHTVIHQTDARVEYRERSEE